MLSNVNLSSLLSAVLVMTAVKAVCPDGWIGVGLETASKIKQLAELPRRRADRHDRCRTVSLCPKGIVSAMIIFQTMS